MMKKRISVFKTNSVDEEAYIDHEVYVRTSNFKYFSNKKRKDILLILNDLLEKLKNRSRT